MSNYKKRSRARLITAVALIAASFCSAFVLSFIANRSTPVLSARATLIPGHTVVESDISSVRVALPDGYSHYFINDRNIIGGIVTRTIAAGELIPSAAITFSESSLSSTTVPISVHGYDIPLNIVLGEKISLYHVGDPKVSSDVTPASLLIRGAYIVGINSKGENLGGDISLTVSIDSMQVCALIDATSSGRIVVVRAHG